MQQRRDFLRQASLIGTWFTLLPQLLKSSLREFPMHQITSGPKSHWFVHYQNNQRQMYLLDISQIVS